MCETEPVAVYASVGVHVDVPVKLCLAPEDGESAWIRFGRNEELITDFADVESLESVRDAAAEGARLLRERIEENRSAADRVRAGRLVGVGVAP